jgi:hypothetical protein
MPETWIHPNRRALALGFALPAALLLVGLGAFAFGLISGGWLWHVGGGVLTVSALLIAALLWRMLQQPRVAYEQGELLFYFDLAPVRVPVDAVECFFIGQAGGMIPDAAGREAEVRTVIVRLAEAAHEWHHRDIKPALGHWCEGYITIRGTWCEPITPELMRKLNARLVEVHRELKQGTSEAA